MAVSLGKDGKKLHGFSLNDINTQILAKKNKVISTPLAINEFTLVRAVLIAWHGSAILQQMKVEPVLIRRRFVRLVKAMLPDGVEANPENYSRAMMGVIATKPVARKYGSLRAGSTVTHKRFWVATFIHQEDWQRL